MADQTTPNPIIAWLSETLQRLFTKSPAYFRVWNFILALLAILPQIPVWLTELGITIPTPLSPVVSKIISIAGIVGLFISKLTVKDATTIAAAPDNQLTFTAAKDLNTTK